LLLAFTTKERLTSSTDHGGKRRADNRSTLRSDLELQFDSGFGVGACSMATSAFLR
jgi:hypothetical protein